jgi:ribosome-associated protein
MGNNEERRQPPAGIEDEPDPDGQGVLVVNAQVKVWPDELEERFVRASGAGGQNVNKVATAVQLSFNATTARGLTYGMRARLRTIAGRRMSKDGVITIDARRFRTQERNRQDARERLLKMLEKASVQPVRRIPTKVSRGAKQRRLDAKRHRAGTKRNRRNTDPDA